MLVSGRVRSTCRPSKEKRIGSALLDEFDRPLPADPLEDLIELVAVLFDASFGMEVDAVAQLGNRFHQAEIGIAANADAE